MMIGKCAICLDEYSQGQIDSGRILEHKLGDGKHGFCKAPCLRDWAQKSSVCPMRCGGEITSALSWHERAFRETSDFFKMRPAVTILAIGTPLLALDPVAAVTAGFAVAMGGIVVGAAAAMAIAAAGAGVVAGAGVAEGGVAATVAAGYAAAAGFAAAKAVRDGPAQRNFFSAGAAVSGLIGASVLINGGGFFLAGALSAVSAFSTYYFKTRFM